MRVRTISLLLALVVTASLLCSAAALVLRARLPVAPPVLLETAVAAGVLEDVDAVSAFVRVKHEGIPLFGMPQMTMSFPVLDREMLAGHSVGDRVVFTLEKRDGTMTVVGLQSSPAPL